MFTKQLKEDASAFAGRMVNEEEAHDIFIH